MRTILGIDVGMSGGVAILRDGLPPEAVKMPATQRDLFDLLNGINAVNGWAPVAFVEKVSSSPQMGVVSAYKFGWSVGSITMACVAAGIRMELVTPQKWQKALGLKPTGHGIGKGDTEKKNRNKAMAQQLFPGLTITHKIADSLLLAEYGRRITNGQT